MKLYVKQADGYYDMWWQYGILDPDLARKINFNVLVDPGPPASASVSTKPPDVRPEPKNED